MMKYPWTLVMLFFGFTAVGAVQYDEVLILQGTQSDATDNTVALARDTLKKMGLNENRIYQIGPFADEIAGATNKTATLQAKMLVAMQKVAKQRKDVAGQSRVLIYWVGHGFPSGVAWNVSIKDERDSILQSYKNISENLERLFPNSKRDIIIEACDAGAGIQDMGKIGETVITSAKAGKKAHIKDMINPFRKKAYWLFSYHFFSALRGVNPLGGRVRADLDKDGVTSLDEAFKFAKNQVGLSTPMKESETYFAGIKIRDFGQSKEASEPQLERVHGK